MFDHHQKFAGDEERTGFWNEALSASSAVLEKDPLLRRPDGLAPGFGSSRRGKDRRCLEMPSNNRQSHNSELFGIKRTWGRLVAVIGYAGHGRAGGGSRSLRHPQDGHTDRRDAGTLAGTAALPPPGSRDPERFTARVRPVREATDGPHLRPWRRRPVPREGVRD